MSTDVQEEGGTRAETIFALVICVIALLLPMIYIEYRYDLFTAEYGEAKEGAAGTGLALAVVFRTVSRTVLRTIVRTSARAGGRTLLKGVVKGAMKNAARSAMRAKTSSVIKETLEDESETQDKVHNNFKSLCFASGLLYLSWIIVIGFGQPYEALLNKEDSLKKEQQAKIEQEQLRIEMAKPAIFTWEKQQDFEAEKETLEKLRLKLKEERNQVAQGKLESRISLQKQVVTHANYEFAQAYEDSNERILDPNEKPSDQLEDKSAMGDWVEYLMSYAPYPGRTSWGSMVLWLGGLVMVLPLWVIFLIQNLAARREGVSLEYQTEGVGGAIQLYFAGAFSFMPLTSDVIVKNVSKEKRGKIAAAGILAPTMISMILWYVWKQTQITEILFVSDAFLLYPMVQVFPLDPLEGIYVFRWKKLYWLCLFFIVMGMFLLAGSEGLKNVI
jgi:hypothetical protein